MELLSVQKEIPWVAVAQKRPILTSRSWLAAKMAAKPLAHSPCFLLLFSLTVLEGTVNQVLLGERHQLTPAFKVLPFQGSGGREGPAWPALTLRYKYTWLYIYVHRILSVYHVRLCARDLSTGLGDGQHCLFPTHHNDTACPPAYFYRRRHTWHPHWPPVSIIATLCFDCCGGSLSLPPPKAPETPWLPLVSLVSKAGSTVRYFLS